MRKLLHILISLCFFAANIAAALPACDSEKSDLSCAQAHSGGRQADQADQADHDLLRADCCSCDHPAVCLGCCHSHTFMSPRFVVSLTMQVKLQIRGSFPANSVISAQPEARIERPPIAVTVV
ncbi:MAG: hypothetical protein NTY08_06910 [Proteobacteria bacterium]|nr:hypothetical protein [Pseudomonadota bacterium]